MWNLNFPMLLIQIYPVKVWKFLIVDKKNFKINESNSEKVKNVFHFSFFIALNSHKASNFHESFSILFPFTFFSRKISC